MAILGLKQLPSVGRLLLLATLCIFTVAVGGANASPAPDRALDTLIQIIMSHAGVTGLQAVAVKDGKVVFSKSYGYAVLDVPGPRRPMQMTTNLDTASVGKFLVTIAVLQQMERPLISGRRHQQIRALQRA